MCGSRDVPLSCSATALQTLASGLQRYGASGGAAEWLVSGAWLCTDATCYLATASVVVLDDGYVARPLCLAEPAELARQVDSELPDIGGRLLGRGREIALPGPVAIEPPPALQCWPADQYTTSVLMRVAQRRSRIDRVAVALLFRSDSNVLLVGTDPSMLALVVSEDPEQIAIYRTGCHELSAEEYAQRFGG